MPSTWHIYADLDALNQDVCAYMGSHPKEFSYAELSKHSPISAHKLTELLSQPTGATKYFHGSYYHLKLKNVEAFRAAGWDMRPKSASKHRTLGHLPKPKRDDDTEELKTLVLVAGKVAGSVLHGVDKYFDAGWRVHCYCLRDRDAKVYDRLAAEYPSYFQCTYLNNSVKSLIKEISGDYEMMVTARAASSVDTRELHALETSSGDAPLDLSSLYEHIHELQGKVLAMEADSENQRNKQHDEMMYQLQQQKEAFEHQLSKHDEEFQNRLREHRKATSSLRKRHEELVEKRMEVCSSEVAAVLSTIEELLEHVKQDVYDYQRTRLDNELAGWRQETFTNNAHVLTDNDQDYRVNSTLLDAVDVLLKQNGVQTGIKKWRAALVVLLILKVTAWLSSATYGMNLVGVLATSIAIIAIASCFVEAV
ncbi:hypothetical protein PR003_g22056 [Phytophthora rubi]|uniref:Uncharacterized protein n=1 Tax=Phytophthora rubi TaxID=129364 RepID=A0A6A3JPQ2_9STRA|nr:hypothetical protein PR001_g19670 [Phytophthora rubi]KAE9303232.1 hypothetical protein PR003_g22056 [Phytophthora rubi]